MGSRAISTKNTIAGRRPGGASRGCLGSSVDAGRLVGHWRVEAAAFKSIVGVWPAEVQWGDCDAAGIIFYPTYFRWFDGAPWALFGSVRHGVKAMLKHGTVMPVLAAQVDVV